MILTIGAIVLGAALLVFTITRLCGLLRESVVARLPAVARQSVSFEQPGTFILSVEHPRFKTALSHANFSLRDAAGARDVRSWPIVLRTTTSGFATVRISVRGFAVERPGRYELAITGISPDSDLSSDALKLTYNMFYHVEHHLFPAVPTRRLPVLAQRLDEAAPEFGAQKVF